MPERFVPTSREREATDSDTERSVVADDPAVLAEICAVPTRSGVTRPDALTVATVLSALAQDKEIPLAMGGPTRAEPPALTRLGSSLASLLEGIAPDKIVEDANNQDLTFLADSTGISKENIASYSIATRLGKTTKLPTELFFALLQQNVPGDGPVAVLASTADGVVDFDKNAERLLDSVLTASPRMRGCSLTRCAT